MPLHPLANFEIQKYYQSEHIFKGVYSCNYLPNTMKDEAYVVNLDEYKSIGTHWIASYVNRNCMTYFDSFVVEHILKEVKRFFGNKNIIKNIFRLQTCDSIMCEYFCTGFVDFIFNGKGLTDFANLFLAHNFKKNDKVILDYILKSSINMSEAHVYDTKLDKTLQCRLSRTESKRQIFLSLELMTKRR